jgi:hypothetical protein
VKNRYPLPRIDDLLDQLHGSAVFSSLDLQSGFHQIRMSEEDVPKTAFLTHKGLFQYRVMPFGLSNAPSTFQALMNKVLAPVLGKFALVYIDDILVFSRTVDEHALHVAEVLGLLRDAHLFVKRSKCSFGMTELRFLGFMVSAEGIRPDPKKVSAMTEWPTPTCLKDVKSYLGAVSHNRKFCPHFSSVAQPLTKLSRKDVPWVWGEQEAQAFERLKLLMTSAPVLALPDASSTAPPFYVFTDASLMGLGGVLVQSKRPVAYESRQLLPAEQNYSVGELELLAVVHALKVWRCYLEGTKFFVVTDHNPLVYLQTQPTLSRRQVAWSEYLQLFDFTWEYRAGRKPCRRL